MSNFSSAYELAAHVHRSTMKLNREEKSLGCGECSAVLVQGGLGSGKSTFLSSLSRLAGCQYRVFQWDCLTLEEQRGDFEERISSIEMSIKRCNFPYLILLDNLDNFASQPMLSQSISNSSCVSSLMSLIDVIRSVNETVLNVSSLNVKHCVVATTTAATNTLHPGLIQPYRFDQYNFGMYKLVNPVSVSDRLVILKDTLNLFQPPVVIGFSSTNFNDSLNVSNIDQVNSLLHEIAAGSQGFSSGELAAIINNTLVLYGSREETSSNQMQIFIQADCFLNHRDQIRPLSSLGFNISQMFHNPSHLHSARHGQESAEKLVNGADADSTNSTRIGHMHSASSSPQWPLVGLELLQQQLQLNVLNPTLSSIGIASDATDSIYKVMGVESSTGILIHGPPGCGKTCLAEWVIAQGKPTFTCLSMSCADLVCKVVGESEKRLSQLFQAARQYAPCFLLLDNIDTVIGQQEQTDVDDEDGDNSSRRKANRTSHKALDRLLSTLLVEIDGLHTPSRSGADTDHGKVLVIATATMNINGLDRSLLRPGRLEEHVCVTLPSESQRKSIVSHHIYSLIRNHRINNAKRLLNHPGSLLIHVSVEGVYEDVEESNFPVTIQAAVPIDLQALEQLEWITLLAAKTDGESPAVLHQLVSEAWLLCLKSRCLSVLENYTKKEDTVHNLVFGRSYFSLLNTMQ